MKFSCPYCGGELSSPTRKRSCPHCKKTIYARTRPNQPQMWVKEEDLTSIEKEWELYHIFFAPACEFRNFIYTEFDSLIAKAKKSFAVGKRDEAWKYYNQAIIVAGEKTSNSFYGQWAQNFQEVFFSMALQLAAEQRYKESLNFFSQAIYFSAVHESIKEVGSVLFDEKEKKKEIEIILNAEYILPPFLLQPLIMALSLSSIGIEEFNEIFVSINAENQGLATKFIKIHEEKQFGAPLPQKIWDVVYPVIKRNFDIAGH